MKIIYKLLLAAAPVLLVAACGGGDDSLDDRLGLADPKVRFVHAIPAGPNADLYRNAEPVGGVTNTAYKFASRYFDVDGSAADYIVRTTTGNVEIGRYNFNPSRGHKYTLIAVPGDATAPNLLFVDDPYNKSLTSSNGRVRVVNASFNAMNVDVYLTEPTVNIATVGPNFASAAFKTAVPLSGSNSNDFSSGPHTLRVTTAGTKNVIFTAPLEVQKNADLLLLTLPNSVAPNDVKILLV
ncbi:MAG TPA: DUF4397 domain-containing protein, partial [Rhizobacter sp.]|nr:DUF4397 domain-containing protein [Rhizobacter sp.]